MTTDEIRKKYIEFFEKKGHKKIDPSPLVLKEDPTTLFTSSGMQQLVPYLKGDKKHSEGKKLVNSQPSFRTVDIEEVGDNRHTTYFEMLGNWSLGEYFKKDQLKWIWEFFTKEIGLPEERLYITIFEGTKEVPKDEESYEIWKDLGIPEERIFEFGVDKNWWSRSGTPNQMPVGEIGGPDSEIFFEFKEVKHDKKFGEKCRPNCECGRFLEIGNSVFIEYKKEKDGSLKELPQKNVDFGGGLERIVASSIDSPDVFKIDVFEPIISFLEKEGGIKYGEDPQKDKSFRIIADHYRAAAHLIVEGIRPSNKLQGYILRRLIRRSIFHAYKLGLGLSESSLSLMSSQISFKDPEVQNKWPEVAEVIEKEGLRFGKALDKGLKELEKAIEDKKEIDGKFAFDLYQTHGFPLELTIEILEENGQTLSKGQRQTFEEEFEKHKELSRKGSDEKFKGGLANTKEETVKLHTATHLIHAALRKVLGDHVKQKGSNITEERLRFDFSHPEKLSDEEIKEIENMVNEKISEGLKVTSEEKTLREATDEGALALFGEKYDEKVKVYTIGDPDGDWFSKEVCGGPHVENIDEVGRVRIFKQDKVGAGVVRIYAKTL